MSNEQRGTTFNSLYLPLIIAIPANIILLFRLSAFEGASWGLVPYAIFTFFLFATGYMSVRRKKKKSKVLGGIYVTAAIIFTVLIFFVI